MSYQSTVPVLPSLDIQSSHDFYVEKLGFDPHFIWQEEGQERPVYGGVSKGDVHIHFVIVEDKKVCEWTICRLYVEDIEDHYAKAQESGIVHPNGPLADKPWGDREFSVLDPSGVCLHIAAPIEG